MPIKKNVVLVDKVFVTGCLSERYRPDLEKEIPNVDQYFGTTELPLLLKALGADYKHELLGERLTTTPKNYAYLKIAEGCDRPCSFCAIPLCVENTFHNRLKNWLKKLKVWLKMV
jgi:ribosomal protein S12 methylthiotransferase